VRRDFLRYDSFYASPSSDGIRVFTVSRAGKVLALSAASGHILWTYRLGTTAYGTPSIANGRVFVGDLSGNLNAFRTTTGAHLWRARVGGRILAATLVVGDLVFFSTLNGHTYAARTMDGRIVWHFRAGKYNPGIATNRRYFFSLNGLLVAYEGRAPAKRRRSAARRPTRLVFLPGRGAGRTSLGAHALRRRSLALDRSGWCARHPQRARARLGCVGVPAWTSPR
jgi:glucose dehydrogenase